MIKGNYCCSRYAKPTLLTRTQLETLFEVPSRPQEEIKKFTMAAALAQVRNALQAIGIVDASHCDAITESITSVEDFVFLTDSFIKDMCNTLRRPGGKRPKSQHRSARRPSGDSPLWCRHFSDG
jgi:hypothetical protein